MSKSKNEDTPGIPENYNGEVFVEYTQDGGILQKMSVKYENGKPTSLGKRILENLENQKYTGDVTFNYTAADESRQFRVKYVNGKQTSPETNLNTPERETASPSKADSKASKEFKLDPQRVRDAKKKDKLFEKIDQIFKKLDSIKPSETITYSEFNNYWALVIKLNGILSDKSNKRLLGEDVEHFNFFLQDNFFESFIKQNKALNKENATIVSNKKDPQPDSSDEDGVPGLVLLEENNTGPNAKNSDMGTRTDGPSASPGGIYPHRDDGSLTSVYSVMQQPESPNPKQKGAGRTDLNKLKPNNVLGEAFVNSIKERSDDKNPGAVGKMFKDIHDSKNGIIPDGFELIPQGATLENGDREFEGKGFRIIEKKTQDKDAQYEFTGIIFDEDNKFSGPILKHPAPGTNDPTLVLCYEHGELKNILATDNNGNPLAVETDDLKKYGIADSVIDDLPKEEERKEFLQYVENHINERQNIGIEQDTGLNVQVHSIPSPPSGRGRPRSTSSVQR